MPQLVILTGPIAAGKNTVADQLAQRLTGLGHIGVVADVDDVAAVVAAPGAGKAGLWFAAHGAVRRARPERCQSPRFGWDLAAPFLR